MSKKAKRPDKEESKFISRLLKLGIDTNLPIVMPNSELMKVLGVLFNDMNFWPQVEHLYPNIWRQIKPPAEYYDLALDWFSEPIDTVDYDLIVESIRFGKQEIEDFATYLDCLTMLHKRRRKYSMILSAQPLPTMVQISPRSLMEYGFTDSRALASWLTWRKFFFDLDNRSAQETGYLFEPILTAALGGISQSARHKVVKRSGDSSKGRQVDCWKVLADGRQLAYEFKLRVTIAASGQGRFKEELQFAEDCKDSGACPILLVLDPTMNPRLKDLQNAFESKGGMAYIGNDAWAHLESEAGPTMALFLEKYVRKPISDISKFEDESEIKQNHQNLLNLEAQYSNDELILKLGDVVRKIKRAEDERFSDDSSTDLFDDDN